MNKCTLAFSSLRIASTPASPLSGGKFFSLCTVAIAHDGWLKNQAGVAYYDGLWAPTTDLNEIATHLCVFRQSDISSSLVGTDLFPFLGGLQCAMTEMTEPHICEPRGASEMRHGSMKGSS